MHQGEPHRHQAEEIESAYRRGYEQGWIALRDAFAGIDQDAVDRWRQALYEWRRTDHGGDVDWPDDAVKRWCQSHP